MEQSEEKRLNKRMDSIEERVGKNEDKIDKVDDKIDIIDDKHDARHLEMRIELTELKGAALATSKHTEQMSNSISALVEELREINRHNNDRFLEVNAEVKSVRDKIESNDKDREFKMTEKTLSNKTIGFIIVGGFGVLQVLIQVVGPLFFG